MKIVDKPYPRIEVVFELDINAFGRIVDLLTMLSLAFTQLNLRITAEGDFKLTLQLDDKQSNPVFVRRFCHILGSLDFVYLLIHEGGGQ